MRAATRARAAALAALFAAAGCAGGVHPPIPSAAGDRSGGSTDALFEGRFPGVMVTTSPSGGIRILMRGGGATFYGSNEPLYVVDGTPLPPGTGGIVMVSPYDVQKIEVLKNPADLALYGVRAANGVIRVTTKHSH